MTTVTDTEHEMRFKDVAQILIGAGALSLREQWPHFLGRVLSIYGLTVVVSSINLVLVNQAPWLTDSTLALSETVLVSLPASFAATIVDHMS
jgi:hypothetical protein